MKVNLFSKKRALLTGLLLFLSTCGIAQAGTLGALTYVIDGDEVAITDCDTNTVGTVVVPSTIEGKSVALINPSFA